MACLVHDARYRSAFHALVNELRLEESVSVSALRSMPHRCCTCHSTDTLTPVVLENREQLTKLKALTDRIDQDTANKSRLTLSLNRLENFLKENRSTKVAMDTEAPLDSPLTSRRPQAKKLAKPIKDGTFLFLPYRFEEKPKSESLHRDATKIQRGRFIGRVGYIAKLEAKYSVCINMITPTTKAPMNAALQAARSNEGSNGIHAPSDAADPAKEEGEWLLIRPKRLPKQEKNTDFSAVLDDLSDRWKACLKVRKRKHDDAIDDK